MSVRVADLKFFEEEEEVNEKHTTKNNLTLFLVVATITLLVLVLSKRTAMLNNIFVQSISVAFIVDLVSMLFG